jgi:hypothetical protein
VPVGLEVEDVERGFSGDWVFLPATRSKLFCATFADPLGSSLTRDVACEAFGVDDPGRFKLCGPLVLDGETRCFFTPNPTFPSRLVPELSATACICAVRGVLGKAFGGG